MEVISAAARLVRTVMSGFPPMLFRSVPNWTQPPHKREGRPLGARAERSRDDLEGCSDNL